MADQVNGLYPLMPRHLHPVLDFVCIRERIHREGLARSFVALDQQMLTEGTTRHLFGQTG